MVVNNTVSPGLHPFFCFSPLSFGEGMRDWSSMMRLMNSISMLGGRRYSDLYRNEFYVMIIVFCSICLLLRDEKKNCRLNNKIITLWRALSVQTKKKNLLLLIGSWQHFLHKCYYSIFSHIGFHQSFYPTHQYCIVLHHNRFQFQRQTLRRWVRSKSKEKRNTIPYKSNTYYLLFILIALKEASHNL